MDMSSTAFGAYLAGISPVPVIASHEVTTGLTSAIINRSNVLYSLLIGLGQKQPTTTVTHYYGIYGTIVLTDGEQYGSFIAIRSRDNVKQPVRWVTTLEGGLMIKREQTHTPYSDVTHVGASVTTALAGAMRAGDIKKLERFTLNLYSFHFQKATARAPIAPPHSSEPGRTPTPWHC